MRTMMIATVGLAFTLAACGDGSAFDESFKSSYREKMITACSEAAKGSIPAGVNIDLSKVCGCTADKIMEGKSAKELMSNAPGSAEDIAKAQQCVTELYPELVGKAK